MRHPALPLLAFFTALLLLPACGDDDKPTPTPADQADADLPDANPPDADLPEPDAAEDTADADPPDADPITCSFPPPTLGTSPEALALAANPAQCGQPAFTWRAPDLMGDPLEIGTPLTFRAADLATLAQAQGLASPRPITYDVQISQLAYVTQDRGEQVAASTVAAWPTNWDQETPPDILMVLHGTAGFNDACSPSSLLETRALAGLFASFGYVVVAPDYLGLKGIGAPTGFPHPYLIAQPTAIASLDAVRAVGKLPAAQRSDTCVSPRLLIVGGSQGGHAALWVDRLAPYYAPELQLLGTVATVPPADLIAQSKRALTEVVKSTGNTIAMLSATGDWYGAQDRYSEVFVSPYDADVPAALASSCDPSDEVDFDAIQSLSDVFQQPLLDAAANDTLPDLAPWGCALAENGLTSTSIPRINDDLPSYNILYILGESDSLVNTPIERASYQTLCEAGMPLTYLECAGAEHTRATTWALPEIFDFIEARQQGLLPPAPTCTPSAPVRCAGTPE